jgi:hypothetical protein
LQRKDGFACDVKFLFAVVAINAFGHADHGHILHTQIVHNFAHG